MFMVGLRTRVGQATMVSSSRRAREVASVHECTPRGSGATRGHRVRWRVLRHRPRENVAALAWQGWPAWRCRARWATTREICEEIHQGCIACLLTVR